MTCFTQLFYQSIDSSTNECLVIGQIYTRQHLNDYLDEAGEEGFVYVSMGTSVNPKTMPPTMLKIIVAAFSQLPYRVLWKFDTELGGIELPANVRIEKWLPQQDVLGELINDWIAV